MKLSNWWPMGLIPVFWLLLWLWSGAVGRAAVLEQQKAAREKVIAVLVQQRIPKADAVAVKAKTIYLPARTHWDSLKITLGDPVAIVALADSTIGKCEAVVLSCAVQVATRDTLIWQQDSLIDLLKKKKPFLLRIGKPVLPFLGGIITGMILTK